MGCYEISLGDTLGVGTIAQVQRLFTYLLRSIDANQLAGHFHDTYGQAVANALKAYELGIRVFDSSVAGLGGCPFAPGAKGNVATEDLVYAFEQLDIPTGIHLDKLIEVGAWITQHIGIKNESRAGEALLSKRSKSTPPNSRPAIKPSARKWQRISDNGDFSIHRYGADLKITLTRPKQGNVLSLGLLHGLTDLLHHTAQDPRISRIVITGHGKYFCTGMDLGSGGSVTESGADAKEEQFNALTNFFKAIDEAPQVTIAMINGPCYGGGIGLAFSCDIRLATKLSTFTLSETKLGLAPAVISKYVLREWGVSVAREAMLSARAVTSSELQRLGIVTSVAKDIDELQLLTDAYLDRIQHSAPRASTLCKLLARVSGDDSQSSIIKSVFQEMMLPSEEARYGVEQFRLGVKPVDWKKLYESKL